MTRQLTDIKDTIPIMSLLSTSTDQELDEETKKSISTYCYNAHLRLSLLPSFISPEGDLEYRKVDSTIFRDIQTCVRKLAVSMGGKVFKEELAELDRISTFRNDREAVDTALTSWKSAVEAKTTGLETMKSLWDLNKACRWLERRELLIEPDSRIGVNWQSHCAIGTRWIPNG